MWSKRFAQVLREWLPLTIQAVEPYMSAEDTEKGSRWSGEIAAGLDASDFGIICMTPENLDAPWIHFEAGALSKSVDRARVSPVLFGLMPSQITGPLVQFQATEFVRDDILKLLRGISRSCGELQLDDIRLALVFDAMWPQLEAQVEKLIAEMSATQVGLPVRSLQATSLRNSLSSQEARVACWQVWIRIELASIRALQGTSRASPIGVSAAVYEMQVLSLLAAFEGFPDVREVGPASILFWRRRQVAS